MQSVWLYCWYAKRLVGKGSGREMKEVILHIGMHKTGTTSIQDSLYGIDSNGFRTIRFAEKNHSIPIYTIFHENKLNYPIWKNQGYNESQIIEKKAAYEKILEEEISDESVDCFILSGEDMSNLTENEQINLCEFFKERNLKVKVIYVVREPFSFAASANQQNAIGGTRALAKVNPGYQRRISGFIKGCGRENISIFKYEQLIQDGLIKTFSEIIGVTLTEKPRRNESVTAEALALIYALNNIKTSTLGSEINFNARVYIVNAIRTFFSQTNGFNKLNLKKFDIVHEDVCDDLVWLEESFGISYQIPVKAEQQELVYEESPSTEILFEFFGNYGLNYQASMPLADNVENLYTKFLRFEEIHSQVQNLAKQKKLLDALNLSKKALELGDERHSAYRQASNISHRLKELDDAITFAKQAVNAEDNNDTTRANHKEHLVNLLRITGQLDDALTAVDEDE